MSGRPRVYLAGPDVFLPDAVEWAARKQAICAAAGLAAVTPLDAVADEPAVWAALPEWQRIARRNEAHIASCAAVIANLTPFRGVSADVGTVYEVGFARARGLTVFGYATVAAPFLHRTLDGFGLAIGEPPHNDPDGMLIEAFGLFDNLMIEGGITGSGGVLIVEERPAAERWRDLTVFERCVRAAAAALHAGG